MANKNNVFTALALLALLGCAPQSNDKAAADSVATAAADPGVVRQAIEAANTRFIDALNKGDLETMMLNFASDAIVMQPNMPAWNGADAIRTSGKALLDEASFNVSAFHTDDVKVSGDLAVETGTFEWTITPKKGGKATKDKGKYVVVWQKQADGSWKVIRDISNSDLSATG